MDTKLSSLKNSTNVINWLQTCTVGTVGHIVRCNGTVFNLWLLQSLIIRIFKK